MAPRHSNGVISLEPARKLRAAGGRWEPATVPGSLPDEDRCPGHFVFAGLLIITFSLLAAGVLQLSSA